MKSSIHLATPQIEQHSRYPKTAERYLSAERSIKVPSHVFFLHDELMLFNYENLCLLILLFPNQKVKLPNGVP